MGRTKRFSARTLRELKPKPSDVGSVEINSQTMSDNDNSSLNKNVSLTKDSPTQNIGGRDERSFLVTLHLPEWTTNTVAAAPVASQSASSQLGSRPCGSQTTQSPGYPRTRAATARERALASHPDTALRHSDSETASPQSQNLSRQEIDKFGTERYRMFLALHAKRHSTGMTRETDALWEASQQKLWLDYRSGIGPWSDEAPSEAMKAEYEKAGTDYYSHMEDFVSDLEKKDKEKRMSDNEEPEKGGDRE